MSRANPTNSSSAWGRVVVIMPTFNEIDSLARVAEHLLTAVPGVDLLIVDDSSPDGTGALADRIVAANPRAHVLHRTTREGLGPAYLAGFAWAREAGYEVVVEMDADGSHPAETLPAMLDALGRIPRPGLVIGSRWIPGGSVVNWPRSRLLLSRAANLYARIALGMPTRDITAGYRAYPMDVLTAISSDVSSHGYSFQIEMALRVFDLGLPIVEVPIVFREREDGSSKMSASIVREAMLGVTRWGLRRRLGGRSSGTARVRAGRS
jgi:dolichol-phosphate mannosyltransferase